MSDSNHGEIVTTTEEKPGQLSAVMFLIGALIYFASPVDFIPDIIPGLCHIDDFALLSMAVRNAWKAFSD